VAYREREERTSSSSVRDSDLSAPRIPTPELIDLDETQKNEAVPADQQPTIDLSHANDRPQIFATWDESQDFFVGPQPVSKIDESPALRRKIYWITLALVASIGAQLGGFIASRLMPSIVEQIRDDSVTHQRVAKSARSIESARRLGQPISDELVRLQREAEIASFSGDVAVAKQKLREIETRWRKGGRE